MVGSLTWLLFKPPRLKRVWQITSKTENMSLKADTLMAGRSKHMNPSWNSRTLTSSHFDLEKVISICKNYIQETLKVLEGRAINN